jgi:DNA-binding transcriptional LysR family regulator
VAEGRVTLGLVSTAKYIVPHMIARFRLRHPGIVVMLRDGNRSVIQAALAEGALDLAIMGQPAPGADVTAERIAAHPSLMIGPAGHKLLEHARVHPELLREEWFIVREEGSGTRSVSEAFFQSAGFAPRVAMETSSNEMIKQAVMAGMGLALLSQHTIGLEHSLGLVGVLPVEGFPIMRSWFVAHRRTSPLLPAQAALRAFLIENGQAIIDAIAPTRYQSSQ